MALTFLVAMGVAGSALAASKIISSKPGGARLYLQRKNIQFSHKLGLLNDFEAAAAYDELRRHYNKLLRPKPIVLASSWSSKEEETKKRTVHYVGPFRPEMTQKEAKLILGLNDAESKDIKVVTKRWRTMMLKNHPDTGGSPFIASKINEAKEIVAGEKLAKEGEDEEDEDGSSVTAEAANEKAKREAQRKSMRDPFGFDGFHRETKDEEEDAGFEDGADEELDVTTYPEENMADLANHPAPPYFSWVNVPAPEIDENIRTAPVVADWADREDMFHRKATRTHPHFLAHDDPELFPAEDWQATTDLRDEQEELLEEEEDASRVYKRYLDPGPTEDPSEERGYYVDANKNPVHTFWENVDDHRLAELARLKTETGGSIEEVQRLSAIERVRRMSEMQARRKRTLEDLKKRTREGKF